MVGNICVGAEAFELLSKYWEVYANDSFTAYHTCHTLSVFYFSSNVFPFSSNVFDPVIPNFHTEFSLFCG